MRVPEALGECAQLLKVAARALKRLAESQAALSSASKVEARLDEVSEIADRLMELGSALEKASLNQDRIQTN